ncbi:NYN domain-containing protein [Sphingobium sufflavum]|uniref:NYN domain-containing protein n=1 Tax=Sphingobium sufflavum TaxID=1129547 RepID=UPI001F459306|nr:NYN domain-containing protein [Sphingobium sufflavum]MCE7795105.1 NYN domain-containing protein [Sphingobium sufflavum]
MSIEPRAPRLAVLIDADNASARIAPGLFEEIARIGEASVRRIYGDFSSPRSKSWSEILARHAINPQHSIAYTTGKNASDIALVIDAMDLLHSGRFDGFCLVSSDSDFTALAARIREQGVDVYGFGEQKTPESFRQACRRFIYTENLLPAAVERGGRPGTAAVASLPDGGLPDGGTPEGGEGDRLEGLPGPINRPPEMAVPFLRRAVRQLDNEDGWVGLGNVGKMLSELNSDFDPRTYGCGKLSTLVEKSGAFDIDRTAGHGVQVRLKPSAPAKGDPVRDTPAKGSPAKGNPAKSAPSKAKGQG